jgi:hypothetical protein
MKLRAFGLFASALASSFAPFANACEVSLPESSDLPAWTSNTPESFTWVGSPKLAAQVPKNGHWIGMGADHSYGDKWWWWREGYSAHADQRPELVIEATRLDAPAAPVLNSKATNAILGSGLNLMLAGMEFPTAGCWEVLATYHDQQLRFVFQVGK